MLYIHTSRENYNKEKFVFETIKGNAIVLVNTIIGGGTPSPEVTG